MREDMAKVIVERPRWGSRIKKRKGSLRRYQRMALEDLPSKEPIRMHSRNLNENLNPLIRFLRSSVGRDWDDVYSEVCERINRNSAVQLHIWQHLKDFVCIHADRFGRPCDGQQRRSWFDFYVDPETHQLRESVYRRRRWSLKDHVDTEPRTIEISDGGRRYQKIDGIWYEMLEPDPAIESPDIHFETMKIWLCHKQCLKVFKKAKTGVSVGLQKLQLNTKEIRQLLASHPEFKNGKRS